MATEIDKKKKMFAEMIINNMDERVSKMAFSQEDLDELFESGETEILICAENLHIPLVEREVFYIGINMPTVVIDSSELVDFDQLGISIQDCYFDEEYSRVISTLADESEVYETEEEIFDIQDFYDEMKEFFSDYRDEMMEISVSEEFEDYFDVDQYEESDTESGEYCFGTKAKARLACKSALEEMISDAKKTLLDCVNDYMSHTAEYLSEIKRSYEEFINDLSNAYDSCASSDCEEDEEEYVMSRKKEFFEDSVLRMDAIVLPKEEIEKTVLKDLNRRFTIRTLLQKCTYDDDGEDYCYEIGSAVDSINDIIEKFISEMEDDLPQQVYGAYRNLYINVLNRLEEKFDDIFSE